MKWMATASEVIKNEVSKDLLTPDIVIYLLIISIISLDICWRILYYMERSRYMEKPYEEVVGDWIRFMERKKIDQEYKDKMMFLLQKAKTDKTLLDYCKYLLFSYKMALFISKKHFKRTIDKLYEHFSNQN